MFAGLEQHHLNSLTSQKTFEFKAMRRPNWFTEGGTLPGKGQTWPRRPNHSACGEPGAGQVVLRSISDEMP